MRGLTDSPRWTDTDRTLAFALTLHEDGLHRCGHPRSLAFEDYNEGLFENVEHVCQACATADRAAAERKDKKPEPGTTSAVVWTGRPGEWRFWTPGNRPRLPDQASQEQHESEGGE